MDFSGNYTPRPIEIVMLNDELDKYIGNDFNVNLSMVSNQAQEQTKFKRMKKTIMKYQLKSLILQLFEIIREQNKVIKIEFVKYEKFLLQNDFVEFLEKIKTGWKILDEKRCNQINKLKQELQTINKDKTKYQTQLFEVRKQLKFESDRVNSFIKQTNRLNQENFSLQQTIKQLTQKIQQLEQKHQQNKQFYQSQIKNLQQSIDSLQLIIRSKQNNIQSLQNNLKKSNKLLDSERLFQLLNQQPHQKTIQSPPKLFQHRLYSKQKNHQLIYKQSLNKYRQRSIHTSPNNRQRSKDRMSFSQMEKQLNNLKGQISKDLNKIVNKRGGKK